MTRFGWWPGLLGVLLLAAPAAAATPDRYRGAGELAARVDRLMDEAWKKGNVTPARVADDAEWLRRVYLDLAGRIPSVTEARTFLADRRGDKRTRLVESLLAGPRYPTWFAGVWRGLLLPEVNSNLQVRIQAPTFERWLRACWQGQAQVVIDELATWLPQQEPPAVVNAAISSSRTSIPATSTASTMRPSFS